MMVLLLSNHLLLLLGLWHPWSGRGYLLVECCQIINLEDLFFLIFAFLSCYSTRNELSTRVCETKFFNAVPRTHYCLLTTT
jgi:hypothetical protein